MADDTATIIFNNDVISNGQGGTFTVTGSATVDYSNGSYSYSWRLTKPDGTFVDAQEYTGPDSGGVPKDANGNFVLGHGTFNTTYSGERPNSAISMVYTGETPNYTGSGGMVTSQTLAPMLTVASDTGASSSDGITSDATPTFTGTVDAGSTVTLYDGTTPVGSTVAGRNGVYTVTASRLGDGTHTFDVTVTDQAGHVSAPSAGTTVTIDTTPPATPAAPTLTAASDSGASASDGITNDPMPTFTGTAEAGSTVTLYDKRRAVGSAVAGTDGTYAVTASTLADRTHTLHVTATDAAGNVSAPSARTQVTIATSPPRRPSAPRLTAASDTGISSRDGITADTTPTFTGTTQAGSTVTLYDGTTVVGSAVAGRNGVYTVTASPLADGTHTLDVTATDAAGNVSRPSAGTDVTVETAPPASPSAPTLTAASDSGASSSDGITNDATPTFTGTVDAGSRVTLYDGTTKVGSVVANANGVYRVTASRLANGTHTLDATATDAVGNVSEVSAGTNVTIDTKRPVASIDGNGGQAASASRLVSGTGEAGSTVTLVDNGQALGTTAVASDGSWSATIGLSAGANHVVARDVDAAGNAGKSGAVTYHYSGGTAVGMASLHSLVQAMSTMTSTSSASMTPNASAATQEAHPLAAAH